MFNVHGDENVENDLSDEYFSSVESDDEDDNIFNSDDCHSDDSGTLYSDDERDDEFDPNLGEENEDNFRLTFGDTITKALILWAVNFGISHTALSALLLILKRFGHEELPKLARTLLGTPRKAVEPRTCAPGEFFYRGIGYNMLQYDHDFLLETDTVEIDFFIDGLSLSDSSKVKMWPIMGSFVNQPSVRPFVVGCYSGNGDPIDVDDFMREFVDEIKELQQNGVRVTKNEVLKKFSFRCFIADAPARSFASGTMGHASYFGCPKCNQVCCGEGHKLYYQYFIGQLRTDKSFRERIDIQHHKPQFQNRSTLLEEVIGMVSQIVIEAMHAVDLGVTKRVCKAIFSNGAVCSKMVPRTLGVLQARFKTFRNYVPSDFARKLRSLTELSKFKATEFRQMLLYTLPVLLKNVVSPQLYSHFLKLHVAIRLLSDPKRYKENITAARKLIKDFVNEYDDTIGKNHFTFYTHCLLHIPDYVEAYGPLYSLSAYKYENHMRVIKRLLRRKHGHVKQFFNRVEEMRLADELESKDKSRNECKFNSFNLKANSLRDGCVMVEPGYPIVITKSFDRNGKTMVCGYRFKQFSDFYDDPLPSMENMGIILCSNLSTTEEEFSATSIIHKFFRLPFENQYVLIPLLHLAITTSKHLQSGTPYLQQTTPHIHTPKLKNVPLVLKSDPRKIKKNGQVSNDSLIKGSVNIPRSFICVSTSLQSGAPIEKTESHTFAVPLPPPRNVKIIKATPIVVPTNSSKCGERASPLQNNSSINQASTTYPIYSNKTSPKFQSNASPVNKTAAVVSKKNNENTPSINIVTKNGLVPIPSNWKLIKVQPNVQSNVFQLNKSKSESVPLPLKLQSVKGTPWNLYTETSNIETSNNEIKVVKDSIVSEKGSGTHHSSYESPSPIINNNREFGSLKSASIPVEPIPYNIMDITPNFESSGISNRGPSRATAIKVISSITIPPRIAQTRKLTSQQLLTTTPIQPIVPKITDTASNGSLNENISHQNSIYGSSDSLNNSLNLSGVATAGMSRAQKQFSSSRGESLITDSDDDENDGQLHAKKKKTSHEENEENRKFEIILEELNKIKTREAKTYSKVNFVVRKLMNEDSDWQSFQFPLDDEVVYEKFQNCLVNERFTNKLVATLKNKIFMSKNIVSDLVETIFDPKLLIKFNTCGLQGKKSFEKSKINEIFLAISGMNRELYYRDLGKVMNKMHMRFTRHHGKYN